MSATISECGKYRYLLDRVVNPDIPGRVLFIGINPSTADAVKDDATVRKWKGFVSRWPEYGRFAVVNLFAYRSKDPKVLAQVEDPDGPYNINTITALISSSDLIVPCWGRLEKIPKPLRWRVGTVMEMLKDSGKTVRVFGYTKCGQPLHPQMLAYEREMIDPWAT
jgi:hypothetical protein